MTKTKRTLGRNWTRYHNWYGMNNILEAACAEQLHWDRETIRRYTLDHAPEVNQVSVQRNASKPPLYQAMMTMNGSGATRRYQVVARHLVSSPQRRHHLSRRRASLKPQKLRARSYQRRSRDRRGRRRSHTGTVRELWLCEKSRGTRSPLNSSSENCLSRGWCEKLLRTWARSTFAFKVGPSWLCKRPQRLT